MPMVTVSISPQQAAGIRAAVDNGGYASSSEVVREALRLWDTARKLASSAAISSTTRAFSPAADASPICSRITRRSAVAPPELSI